MIDYIYEGETRAGVRHGQGRCRWVQGQFAGDSYEGEWQNDQMTGRGTYLWSTGNRYEGTWLCDQMHGHGSFWYSTGDHYEGEYDAHRRHGWGMYTWSRGPRFEGWFHNEQPQSSTRGIGMHPFQS